MWIADQVQVAYSAKKSQLFIVFSPRSAECQFKDWKEHKARCGKDSKPHEVEVTPTVGPGFMSSIPMSQFMEQMARTTAGEAVPKVEVS